MRQIRFGEWCYHPDTLELSRGPVRRAVEPRVARLLEFLLEHPGELLTHDRLIETVWDGRVVTDEAVRRAVSTLRRVLGPEGAEGIVRTIHKKGYIAVFPPPARPIAAPRPSPTVLRSAPTPPAQPPPSTPVAMPPSNRPQARRRDLPIKLALAACLLALVLGSTWLALSRAPARSPAADDPFFTLAVLPFANRGMTAAPGDAIAVQLRGALALNPVFRIAGAPAVAQLDRHRHDPRMLGQVLGVRYVLDGSVRRRSERVQILAQLVDSATGSTVWSGSYERAPAELDALAEEIATDVSRALKVVLVSADSRGEHAAPLRI